MLSVPAATTTAPADDGVALAVRVECTRRPSPLPSAGPRSDPLDVAPARSVSPWLTTPRWIHVFCVDLPELVGQPCRQEPQRMQVSSV